MKVAIDPDELNRQDSYKLLTGIVVPRPIGWIGTRSVTGDANLAPFSFFNAVSGHPPTVLFSPGRFEGRPKDSWRNAEETGEFTVNIVSVGLLESMNATAARVAHGVDEFELAGLRAVAADLVKAPIVGECAANLECRVTQIVPTGEPPLDAVVIFGQVVRFHIDEALLDGSRVDQVQLDAIGRLAGPRYATTREILELERPG
jgi:flavin reductase (DIM6/NTAB) family NADH-FMN oxidoreductase RutF